MVNLIGFFFNFFYSFLNCFLIEILSNVELLKRVLGSADLNLATELHLLLGNNSGTLGDFRDLITGKFSD